VRIASDECVGSVLGREWKAHVNKFLLKLKPKGHSGHIERVKERERERVSVLQKRATCAKSLLNTAQYKAT
jgi:hypothetical protein